MTNNVILRWSIDFIGTVHGIFTISLHAISNLLKAFLIQVQIFKHSLNSRFITLTRKYARIPTIIFFPCRMDVLLVNLTHIDAYLYSIFDWITIFCIKFHLQSQGHQCLTNVFTSLIFFIILNTFTSTSPLLFKTHTLAHESSRVLQFPQNLFKLAKKGN